MRILLLTAYFPPDTGSAAHLFYELGSELVRRGHRVSVVTSLPGYHPTGSLEQYRGKKRMREYINGMHVVRVSTPRMPRALMIGRAFWQFGSAFAFFRNALRLSHHDVVIVYSPPLPLGLTAWGLQKIWKIPYVLNVQDLFPQSIIDLRLLKNAILIRFFEAMERFVYKSANTITVHSEGNRQHVVKKGADSAKVFVVPNWVDTDFVRPGNRNSEFRKSMGLDSQFVVSFAGVIGYSQDIDVILEAAKLLNDENTIPGGEKPIWLIVGDGVEKARLEKKAGNMRLTNVRFVPMLPKDQYVGLLQASDVCLSTLHADVKTPVVPSKILSIMAAGRPVVAAMNLDGDAPELIRKAQCGICVPPEDPKALASAILQLYQDPKLGARLGQNGRRYAEKNLSLKVCASKYEELLRAVVNQGQRQPRLRG